MTTVKCNATPMLITHKAQQVITEIESFAEQGKRIMATSSFQTQSLPLLHLLTCTRATIPVIFIDTGYHFPETLAFRDQVVEQLGLQLMECRPPVPKSEQRDCQGHLLFLSNPEQCCYLNKVMPLHSLLRGYDVWISGVRADQSDARRNLQRQQPGVHGVLRHHPLLDWSAKDIYDYRRAHRLPEHPLEARGISSVGCLPCTAPPLTEVSVDRSGRWLGQAKTECGLHTELNGDGSAHS